MLRERILDVVRGPQVDALVGQSCTAIFDPGSVLEGRQSTLRLLLDLAVLPRDIRFGCSTHLAWGEEEVRIRDVYLSSPESGLVEVSIELASHALPEAALTHSASGWLIIRFGPSAVRSARELAPTRARRSLSWRLVRVSTVSATALSCVQ